MPPLLQYQEILPLTSRLSCPSSPSGDGGWGGLLAIYYLPVPEREDRLAPALPGGGLGLGRRSSHSISRKDLWGVGCACTAAATGKGSMHSAAAAGGGGGGGTASPSRLGAPGPSAQFAEAGARGKGRYKNLQEHALPSGVLLPEISLSKCAQRCVCTEVSQSVIYSRELTGKQLIGA